MSDNLTRNVAQFVAFRIENQTYAFRIEQIQEIVIQTLRDVMELGTQMPGMPPEEQMMPPEEMMPEGMMPDEMPHEMMPPEGMMPQ